jgi:hypothetical protein
MRLLYRILAFIIAVEVAIQAAVMVWAVAGLYVWVDGGGVLDSAVLQSEEAPPFDEALGFMLHGMNGMMVIPALALILLIVSFFAKVRGGVVRALVLLVLIVLQVFLGLWGHEAAILGLFHGLNAFLIYGGALMAGIRARKPASEPVTGNATQ